MSDGKDKKSLLGTIVFRPLNMRKWFTYSGVIAVTDDVKNNNSSSVTTGNIIQSSSSSLSIYGKSGWEKLKEFCSDENISFEKWITLKSLQVAFFSQAALELITRIALFKTNSRNMGSNVSDGLRKCLMKSIISSAVMAGNIGFIMISITQFVAWREHFSLWTVPCATTVIPTILSYPLGVKPSQAMKSGLALGLLSSLAIFSVSVLYDLSVNETYQRIKNNIEIRLKEERESELYKFMKEHRIHSKWFGKWMLNRSHIDEDADDDLSF